MKNEAELWEKLNAGLDALRTQPGIILNLTGNRYDYILALALSLKKFKMPIEAYYLPSSTTSSVVYDASKLFCERSGLPLKSIPIKFLQSATKNALTQSGFQFEHGESAMEESLRMAVLEIIAHEKKFMLGRGQDYLENLDGKKLENFITYINQTHDSIIPDIMYKS